MDKKTIIAAIFEAADSCPYDYVAIVSRIDAGRGVLSAGQIRWIEQICPGAGEVLKKMNSTTAEAVEMQRHAEFNRLIDSLGIKKEKIASLAGVTPSTMSQIIAGRRPVPPLLLEKMRKINEAMHG